LTTDGLKIHWVS